MSYARDVEMKIGQLSGALSSISQLAQIGAPRQITADDVYLKAINKDAKAVQTEIIQGKDYAKEFAGKISTLAKSFLQTAGKPIEQSASEYQKRTQILASIVQSGPKAVHGLDIGTKLVVNVVGQNAQAQELIAKTIKEVVEAQIPVVSNLLATSFSGLLKHQIAKEHTKRMKILDSLAKTSKTLAENTVDLLGVVKDKVAIIFDGLVDVNKALFHTITGFTLVGPIIEKLWPQIKPYLSFAVGLVMQPLKTGIVKTFQATFGKWIFGRNKTEKKIDRITQTVFGISSTLKGIESLLRGLRGEGELGLVMQNIPGMSKVQQKLAGSRVIGKTIEGTQRASEIIGTAERAGGGITGLFAAAKQLFGKAKSVEQKLGGEFKAIASDKEIESLLGISAKRFKGAERSRLSALKSLFNRQTLAKTTATAGTLGIAYGITKHQLSKLEKDKLEAESLEKKIELAKKRLSKKVELKRKSTKERLGITKSIAEGVIYGLDLEPYFIKLSKTIRKVADATDYFVRKYVPFGDKLVEYGKILSNLLASFSRRIFLSSIEKLKDVVSSITSNKTFKRLKEFGKRLHKLFKLPKGLQSTFGFIFQLLAGLAGTIFSLFKSLGDSVLNKLLKVGVTGIITSIIKKALEKVIPKKLIPKKLIPKTKELPQTIEKAEETVQKTTKNLKHTQELSKIEKTAEALKQETKTVSKLEKTEKLTKEASELGKSTRTASKISKLVKPITKTIEATKTLTKKVAEKSLEKVVESRAGRAIIERVAEKAALKAGVKLGGRIAAHFIPGVGEVLLAYDIYQGAKTIYEYRDVLTDIEGYKVAFHKFMFDVRKHLPTWLGGIDEKKLKQELDNQGKILAELTFLGIADPKLRQEARKYRQQLFAKTRELGEIGLTAGNAFIRYYRHIGSLIQKGLASIIDQHEREDCNTMLWIVDSDEEYAIRCGYSILKTTADFIKQNFKEYPLLTKHSMLAAYAAIILYSRYNKSARKYAGYVEAYINAAKTGKLKQLKHYSEKEAKALVEARQRQEKETQKIKLPKHKKVEVKVKAVTPKVTLVQEETVQKGRPTKVSKPVADKTVRAIETVKKVGEQLKKAQPKSVNLPKPQVRAAKPKSKIKLTKEQHEFATIVYGKSASSYEIASFISKHAAKEAFARVLRKRTSETLKELYGNKPFAIIAAIAYLNLLVDRLPNAKEIINYLSNYLQLKYNLSPESIRRAYPEYIRPIARTMQNYANGISFLVDTKGNGYHVEVFLPAGRETMWEADLTADDLKDKRIIHKFLIALSRFIGEGYTWFSDNPAYKGLDEKVFDAITSAILLLADIYNDFSTALGSYILEYFVPSTDTGSEFFSKLFGDTTPVHEETGKAVKANLKYELARMNSKEFVQLIQKAQKAGKLDEVLDKNLAKQLKGLSPETLKQAVTQSETTETKTPSNVVASKPKSTQVKEKQTKPTTKIVTDIQKQVKPIATVSKISLKQKPKETQTKKIVHKEQPSAIEKLKAQIKKYLTFKNTAKTAYESFERHISRKIVMAGKHRKELRDEYTDALALLLIVKAYVPQADELIKHLASAISSTHAQEYLNKAQKRAEEIQKAFEDYAKSVKLKVIQAIPVEGKTVYNVELELASGREQFTLDPNSFNEYLRTGSAKDYGEILLEDFIKTNRKWGERIEKAIQLLRPMFDEIGDIIKVHLFIVWFENNPIIQKLARGYVKNTLTLKQSLQKELKVEVKTDITNRFKGSALREAVEEGRIKVPKPLLRKYAELKSVKQKEKVLTEKLESLASKTHIQWTEKTYHKFLQKLATLPAKETKNKDKALRELARRYVLLSTMEKYWSYARKLKRKVWLQMLQYSDEKTVNQIVEQTRKEFEQLINNFYKREKSKAEKLYSAYGIYGPSGEKLVMSAVFDDFLRYAEHTKFKDAIDLIHASRAAQMAFKVYFLVEGSKHSEIFKRYVQSRRLNDINRVQAIVRKHELQEIRAGISGKRLSELSEKSPEALLAIAESGAAPKEFAETAKQYLQLKHREQELKSSLPSLSGDVKEVLDKAVEEASLTKHLETLESHSSKSVKLGTEQTQLLNNLTRNMDKLANTGLSINAQPQYHQTTVSNVNTVVNNSPVSNFSNVRHESNQNKGKRNWKSDITEDFVY